MLLTDAIYAKRGARERHTAVKRPKKILITTVQWRRWLRSFAAVAAALALFLPSFGTAGYARAAQPDSRGGMLDEEDRIARYAIGGWQVHWGDRPGEKGAAWTAFTPRDYPKLASYRGILWLRTDLPSLAEWRDPYLFLHNIKNVAVSIDTPDNRVYSYQPAGVRGRYTSLMKLHPVRLQQGDAGKTLYLRLEWDRQPVTANWLMIGTRVGMIFGWLDYEWRWYAFGVLCLAIGLISLCLYAWRPKDRICGWFALLCLSAGIGFLLLSVSLQWFLPWAGQLYYWRELLLPVAILAVLGFYDQALRCAYRRLYAWLKAAALAFTATAAATALFDAPLYGEMMTRWFPLFFIAVFGAISYSLIRHAFLSLTRETLWLGIAYCVLMAAALLHLAFNATVQAQAQTSVYGFYRALAGLFELMLPVGFMAFIVCLTIVLFVRYAAAHGRLEAYADELVRRNRTLEELDRRKGHMVNGMADIERLRSNGIQPVQGEKKADGTEPRLPGAKRVVPHPEDRIPAEPTPAAAAVEMQVKLPAAGRTHGLADAAREQDAGARGPGVDGPGVDGPSVGGPSVGRRPVRTLEAGREPFGLADALRALIGKAAATGGVRIDADIDAPRLDAADGILQQLILDALREGLTNGIRHGACSHFRFRLSAAHERLSFRLFNDGSSYGGAKPGTGLSALMERVRLLGGEMSIGTPPAAMGLSPSGKPWGCELIIVMPFAIAGGERSGRL